MFTPSPLQKPFERQSRSATLSELRLFSQIEHDLGAAKARREAKAAKRLAAKPEAVAQRKAEQATQLRDDIEALHTHLSAQGAQDLTLVMSPEAAKALGI